MQALDTKLQSAIDRFASDLADLVRQSMFDSVRGAFDGATQTRHAALPANPVERARGSGAKRPPEELERVKAQLRAYVTANPGQRIEEIAGGMGVETRELALPAKELLAEKAIKKRGVKRATRYLPK